MKIRGACNLPKVTQLVNRVRIWAQVCPAPGLFSAQGAHYFPGSFNGTLSWTWQARITLFTWHLTVFKFHAHDSHITLWNKQGGDYLGQWGETETQGGLSVLCEEVGNNNSKHFLNTSYLHAWHSEKYFISISHWVPLKLQEMSAFIIPTLQMQGLALKY